jgi:hypothetical protein
MVSGLNRQSITGSGPGGQPWIMYAQEQGYNSAGNGLSNGKIVLISANGAQRIEYNYVSGGHGKGNLPGLHGDKDLSHGKHRSNDPNNPNFDAPNDVFQVGARESKESAPNANAFRDSEGQSWGIHLLGGDTSRDGFLIHPGGPNSCMRMAKM